jgi:hypothetical protein
MSSSLINKLSVDVNNSNILNFDHVAGFPRPPHILLGQFSYYIDPIYEHFMYRSYVEDGETVHRIPIGSIYQ